MSNVLTALTPKLIAQGQLALRQFAVTPRLVNSTYSGLAGQKGSTIDVPIPSAIAAADVAPSNTPPSTGVVAPTSVPIALNNWKEAAFYLTDSQAAEALDSEVMRMEASEAIKSLANAVDISLLALYKGVYGYKGTAGTTPMASSVNDVVDVRTVLNQQLCPLEDRRFLLDPLAEANALKQGQFTQVQQSGDNGPIIRGTIGQKFGFDFYMNQNVVTHTAGTITTGLVAKASTAQAAGLVAIVATTAASTGACALKKGDIINIAGQNQTYTLTADATQASAASDVTLNISPALQTALAGSEAITVKASHVVNLAFHRDAFAFASRPLDGAVSARQLGSVIEQVIDEITGITLRLEVTREHKRTRFAYDILWGVGLVRPELACRLAG